MIVNCCLICNRLVSKLLCELMLVLLVGIVYRWVRKYLNCIFLTSATTMIENCRIIIFTHNPSDRLLTFSNSDQASVCLEKICYWLRGK
jgi:hypothetical protein